MTARIATVSNVRRHGDNLTIVTIADGDNVHEVVANLDDDGAPRWAKDEIAVYVAEGSLIPEDVLRERNYWDEAGNGGKGKGEFEGKQGNRVKMRRFAGFESRGVLFKTTQSTFMGSDPFTAIHRQNHPTGGENREGGPLTFGVDVGDDVTAFFGITEHGA